MSMPSFPPCGADMTKEEALTMIIASIAMEELALSHIVNAEGEKLQYVLGTLPGSCKPCASTQEILAVNKSVASLLDTVAQSQMLLKGKLEKALEAGGREPDPPLPSRPPVPAALRRPVLLRKKRHPAGRPVRGVLLGQRLSSVLEAPGTAWMRHWLERGKPRAGGSGPGESLCAELRRQRPRPLPRGQRGGRLRQAHALRRLFRRPAPLFFRERSGA